MVQPYAPNAQLPSGLVHIQLPLTAAATIGTIIHGQGAKASARMMLATNASVAAILPLRLIAPY